MDLINAPVRRRPPSSSWSATISVRQAAIASAIRLGLLVRLRDTSVERISRRSQRSWPCTLVPAIDRFTGSSNHPRVLRRSECPFLRECRRSLHTGNEYTLSPTGAGRISARSVRFGSLAGISKRIRNVRFTPESGHAERQQRCPLSANSGHPTIGLDGAARGHLV